MAIDELAKSATRGMGPTPNPQEKPNFFVDVLASPFRGVEGAIQGIYDLADYATGDDLLPDYNERFLGRSQTFVGGLGEGITQFLTGFIPVAGVAGRIGALTKVGKAGKKALNLKGYAAAGAVADFSVFQAQEQRLSNLIQAFPSLANPVNEYLAADEDDGEIEGRFKNTIEGLALGGMADSLFAGVKALKRKRGGEADEDILKDLQFNNSRDNELLREDFETTDDFRGLIDQAFTRAFGKGIVDDGTEVTAYEAAKQFNSVYDGQFKPLIEALLENAEESLGNTTVSFSKRGKDGDFVKGTTFNNDLRQIDMQEGGARTFVHELMHATTSAKLGDEFTKLAKELDIEVKGNTLESRAIGANKDALETLAQQKDANPIAGLADAYLQVVKALEADDAVFGRTDKEVAGAEIDSGTAYGLTNLDEFIAESFTNPEFRRVLMEIPSTNGTSKTMFEQFTAVIKKMLGLQGNQGTLLDDVFKYTDEIVRDQDAMFDGSFDQLKSIDDLGNRMNQRELSRTLDDRGDDFNPIQTVDRISPELLRENPNKFYLFGDNLEGKGKGGQAIVRDEPNAIGIPTKKAPRRDESAYFTDDELRDNKAAIDKAFDKLPDDAVIVIPEDGLGTGLADLPRRAPKTFAYLESKIDRLRKTRKVSEMQKDVSVPMRGKTMGKFTYPVRGTFFGKDLSEIPTPVLKKAMTYNNKSLTAGVKNRIQAELNAIEAGYAPRVDFEDTGSRVTFDNKKAKENRVDTVTVKGSVAGVRQAEKAGEGVSVLRKDGEEHYGNPFSHLKTQTKDTIATKDLQETVSNYKAWLEGTDFTDVKQERRKWVLDQIDSGALDGKQLLYHSNQQPNHASVLASFIKQRRSNTTIEGTAPYKDAESYLKAVNQGGVTPKEAYARYLRNRGGTGGLAENNSMRLKEYIENQQILRGEPTTGKNPRIQGKSQFSSDLERAKGKGMPDSITDARMSGRAFSAENSSTMSSLSTLESIEAIKAGAKTNKRLNEITARIEDSGAKIDYESLKTNPKALGKLMFDALQKKKKDDDFSELIKGALLKSFGKEKGTEIYVALSKGSSEVTLPAPQQQYLMGQRQFRIKTDVIDKINAGKDNDFLFHRTGNLDETIITKGLIQGGVTIKSPIEDRGFGDIVYVFNKSDFPEGTSLNAVEYSKNDYTPAKPVTAFHISELKNAENYDKVGARAEELGDFVEPDFSMTKRELEAEETYKRNAIKSIEDLLTRTDVDQVVMGQRQLDQNIEESLGRMANDLETGGDEAIRNFARGIRDTTQAVALVQAIAKNLEKAPTAKTVSADELIAENAEVADILGGKAGDYAETIGKLTEATDLSNYRNVQNAVYKLIDVMTADVVDTANKALEARVNPKLNKQQLEVEFLSLLDQTQEVGRIWSLMGREAGLTLVQRKFLLDPSGKYRTKSGIGFDAKTAQPKDYDKYVNENRAGTMPVDKMIDLVAGSSDKASAKRNIKKTRELAEETFGSKAMDVTMEVWMNSLLSGPTTQIVNILGNSLTLAIRNIEQSVGALLTGDPQLARATLKYAFDMESFMDVIRISAQTFKTGESRLVQGSKAFEDKMDTSKAIVKDGNGTLATAINTLGAGIRIPSRALAFGDEFFKQMNYRSYVKTNLAYDAMKKGAKSGDEIAEYVTKNFDNFITKGARAYNEKGIYMDAVDAAKAQGLKFGKEQEEFIAQYLKDNPFDETRGGLSDAAKGYAEETTFTNDLENEGVIGTLSNTLNTLKNKGGAWRTLNFVIPFLRTPTNILKFSIDRTPLGTVGMVATKAKRAELTKQLMSEDPVVRAQIRGKLAVSTAATASILYYMNTNKGMITGGGPPNRDELESLRLSGWRPYSIKVGDTYYSYQRADPIATVLGLFADIIEGQQYHDVEDIISQDMVALGVLSLTQNVTNKSYVKGLDTLLQLVRDPVGNFKPFAGNIVGGFAPTFFTQIQNMADERELKETRSIFDYWLKKMPIAQGTLPSRRNFLGEVMKNQNSPYMTGVINPIYFNKESSDPVDQELGGLQHGFSQPSTKLYNAIEMRDVYNSEGRQAFDRYLELSSTTKIGGKTMRQSLREMVKDKGYQALPKESADDLGELSPRIKAVQRLVRAYRRKGRYEMLEEFPELKDSIYTLQQEKSQYRLIQ